MFVVARNHGDALLLIVLGLVAGYALLLFSQYIYPPIFLPEPPPVERSVFNAPLYAQVLERIEANPRDLQHKLDAVPRNPFAEPAAPISRILPSPTVLPEPPAEPMALPNAPDAVE